jgi:ribosomal protein S9
MSRLARLRNAAPVLLLGVLLAALLGGAPAQAAGTPANAWWRLSSRAAPTNLPPGGAGILNVAAEDFGPTGVSGAGNPIVITDVLPAGVRVSNPEAVYPHRARAGGANAAEKARYKCTVAELRTVSCSTELEVPPFEPIELEIPIEVTEPAGTSTTLPNQVSVQGGSTRGTGAPVTGRSLTKAMKVSEEPVRFGLEEGGFAIVPENADGSLDTQAGSHPFQLTSTVNLNEILEDVRFPGDEKAVIAPAAPALQKDLKFELPPGLLGSVTATKRCTQVDFAAVHGQTTSCPTESVIGVATVTLEEPNSLKYATLAVPLYNLEPAPGEPARFGFEAAWVPVVLDVSVRTGGDYGVTVDVRNTTEAAQVLGAQVTFWGDPGDEAHDQSRNWPCLREGALHEEGEICAPPNPRPTDALLTLPTACVGPLLTQMSGDAWNHEQISGSFTFEDALGNPLAHLEGCASLPFEPAIGAEPVQPPDEGRPEEHVSAANTPTGLNVDVKLAQQTTLQPDALAESTVQSATVTLPPGVLLNPSAANGLQACSEQQIGYLGTGGDDPFAPGTTEPLHFSTAPAECPNASKVGTVRVKTPLLDQELTGSVYLAAQEANPFGSLIAIYAVAENEALGIRAKLAGEGKLDPVTGQISTTFTNTPQVPFEDLKVQLFGGPRAPLSTPSACGTYATTASFTPWSGTGPVQTSSDPNAFAITSGPGGSACASPQSFAPSFVAGVSNPQAGAFTSFSLEIAKTDSDQQLTGVTVHLPPGAAAMLSSLTPCQEPAASQGTCGPESLIGHATATAGLGPEPFTVTGGRVYLTGPYGGGPFGLSIVTPAVAGPFNLGEVVVRSSIKVDPTTAAVTIESSLPTIVQGVGKAPSGVPLQLKRVDVVVDRPNFEFNPTNCNPLAVTGTLTGSEGGTENVSTPFHAANCSTLPFKPTMTITTKGNASKANGAELKVKVTSAPGQANIGKVRLVLPLQLPSRLTTIQKACRDTVFEVNPANCDEGSNIGYATAVTPVLKSPLTGPAYLVSHGNAAFPDVEFVLKGEGVTIVLDGQTDIKKGITTSTFNTVPDAPVSTFETVLPEGPHSALTSNVPASKNFSLCGQKLVIPTTITGQNGAVIQQETKVPVEGCGAVKGSKTTRVQKLAKALKQCRKKFKHSARKRKACESQARKQYGKKAKHRSGRAKAQRTKPAGRRHG